MKAGVCVLAVLSAASAVRAASILNSKHDLSADSATSGPKALAEQDTCLFCHVSHRPAAKRPLWNRADQQVSFTFYSSNYLNSYLGQVAPTMTDLAGSKTKLCLSCHDGVTAIGGVYNLAPNTIEMTGSMSPSAVLGTDLRNDHPVLYDVKPGAGPPTESGTDPEIRLPPAGDRVRVYGATNRVECTSCHDAHDDQYGKFLVKSNAGAGLCTTCHIKSNYSGSSHATSVVPYSPPEGGQTTVGQWSCRNCHKTHGASPAQPYLLRSAEEGTCYACHGSPPLSGAKGIKTQFLKTYRHPTEAVAGAHLNPETNASNLGLGRRHAECWDCHNPHEVRAGGKATPGNKIGNTLLGQWGVEPAYGSTPWAAASSYLRQKFLDTASYLEYQLCFKCHSSYAFGTTPPTGSTDASIEFNPNNRSAHPIRSATGVQAGALTPKGLTAAQMSSPWTNVGSQTMGCSDCHGSDVSSDPKGPHGSSAGRLLKGPRKFWPKNASGGLWTLKDIKDGTNAWSESLFCVNCHPLYQNGAWKNEVHREHEGENPGGAPIRCIACHVVVPHGSKRGRMIGYESDPAPYNYLGASAYDRLLIRGFRKASGPFNYSQSNCSSAASGCHTGSGTYDP